MKPNNPLNSMQRRFRLAVLAGLSLSTIGISIIQITPWQYKMAPGPMNIGHQSLACLQCHIWATGTLRQQIQANVQYVLGNRENPQSIGYRPVRNKVCRGCHQRPKDNHPVYRFMEPKFKEARRTIQAHLCNACHREHRGTRVSANSKFCSHCHKKLRIKNDPLDIKHQVLIRQKQWNSCLGCHDFHGNYRFTLPNTTDKAIPDKVIQIYLRGGRSPYGPEKRYKARKMRNEPF